jgi:tRNA (guanine26-N2/guanine27-N2)-dimethyltransferase
MAGEAEPLLSPWYIHLDEVGRQGRLAGPPGRDALAGELRRRGFAACATHIEPRGVKTNASMAECIAAVHHMREAH